MAADPTKCKINVLNGTIISEWTGTFGEFKGLVKPEKPATACTQSDYKAMLQQWLIAQLVCACIVFPLQMVIYIVAAVVSGGSPGDVISAYLGSVIWGVIGAFLSAWLGWFMLIKRQPNCCCCCIIWIEDWKFQHLVFGLFSVFNGLSQLMNAINGLLAALDLMSGLGMLYVICYLVVAVLMAVYAICQIYVGRAAVGMGQEIAGVNLPTPTVPGKDSGEAA